jgi:hypothetical protein
MNNFTYGKNHPSILAAGERMQAEDDKKFEAAKSAKQRFAIMQDFYDFIGYHRQYTKEIFVELKKHLKNEPFHIISDDFTNTKIKNIRIDNIKPGAKSAIFEIYATDKDGSFEGHIQVKVKYGCFFKMQKEVNKQLFDFINENNIPNNYDASVTKQNIWEFDFSKINFLQK